MIIVKFILNIKQEDGTYLFKFGEQACLNHKSAVFTLAIKEDGEIEKIISYVDKKYYSSITYVNN